MPRRMKILKENKSIIMISRGKVWEDDDAGYRKVRWKISGVGKVG